MAICGKFDILDCDGISNVRMCNDGAWDCVVRLVRSAKSMNDDFLKLNAYSNRFFVRDMNKICGIENIFLSYYTNTLFTGCIQPNLVQSLNAERPKKKLKIDRNVVSCAKTTFWRFACILANIALLFRSVLAR